MRTEEKKAIKRLIEFDGIVKSALKSLASNETGLREAAHVSTRTRMKMKSAMLGRPDVYLRIVIALLRFVDWRMKHHLLPPDFEVGLIRRILEWYDREED